MTLSYRVELTPDDNGTLMVTCPAIPPMVTFGWNEADALHHAVDAAEEMLASYVADGDPIPPADDEHEPGLFIRLSLLASLKLELYEACRTSAVSRAELARRLGWHREQVDRLFRLNHASRLDQIEAAFRAVGREVDVEVRPAA